MKENELVNFLNSKLRVFNQPGFIKNDPISVPHRYKALQDIEIAGFFSSILAWGNRTTIINKATELMQLMDNAPHQFIIGHKDNEVKKMLGFKHRTFTATDLLYFISFLKYHYSNSPSLETAFSKWMKPTDTNTENALNGFYDYFFSLEDVPARTRKHIARPSKKSTCKRLNMFLRWMVRRDRQGVDFGLWKQVSPAQLICPIDLHVARVARRLHLIKRKSNDWLTAVELTEKLKRFDPHDPVKYDFVLFGLGAMEGF